MKLILLSLIIGISIVSIAGVVISLNPEPIPTSQTNHPVDLTKDVSNDYKIFLNTDNMEEFEKEGIIFKGSAPKDFIDGYVAGTHDSKNVLLLKHPDFENLYEKLQYDEKSEGKTVVVMPTLTAIAYSEPGFYSYYRGECDVSCLVMPLTYIPSLDFRSSGFGVQTFDLLGYEIISEIEIDTNPNILKKYDKVILLHSEYVTKKMFDSITSHPNVVYLYPNALYGEIKINYDENTMELIRGHGYPEPSIDNGFDWEFENTRPYEYDTECNDWEFYPISNGHMLNCYPENIIIKESGIDLLMALKEL